MRLNKYIAQAGVTSRRKADELTAEGKVKVNGLTMKEMGYQVAPGDVIEVDGHVITPEKKKVYYMLNKPAGYLTAAKDESNRATVMDLMASVEERVFPVGRLDYNTTGLLIMTNDGELAYGLTHPKHQVYKTYRVTVSGMFPLAKAKQLDRGVDIGGFITSKSMVEILSQNDHHSIVEIKIFEGKNRQVRKMFKAVGHTVIELERTAIGNLKMGHLKEGHFKRLSKNEVNYLQQIIEDKGNSER